MPSSFTDTLARRLDSSPEAVEEALRTLAEEVRTEAAREGQSSLDGLGTFSRERHALAFEPEAPLAALINRHYEGLEPLPLASVPEQLSSPTERQPAAKPSPPPAEEQTEAEPAAPPGEDTSVPTPAWEPTETPDDHPLGPLSEPPYEDADYAVMEAEDEEEHDESDAAPRPVAIPLEVLRTPLAPVIGGAFEANLRLPADPLKDARFASPGQPAPEEPPKPAPDRAPEQRESRRRPYATSALSWIGGLLILVLLGGGLWYFLGEQGAVPPFPLDSDPPPANSDGPRALTSAAPIPPPADSEEVTSAALADTTAAAPVFADKSTAPAPDTLGFALAEGEWALVVASRTDRAIAERALRTFRERFAGSGLAADLLIGETDGVRRYRVAIGPFPSLDAANAAGERYSERLPPGAWPLRFRE